MIERVWPRAVKHEAFSQTTEANSLQFPLKTEVVPSNRKSAESVGAVGNKWENRHRFEALVSYVYSHA